MDTPRYICARRQDGAFWCEDTTRDAVPTDSQNMQHPLGQIWITDDPSHIYVYSKPEAVEQILTDFAVHGGGVESTTLIRYHNICHWCDNVTHPFQEAELSCYLSKKDRPQTLDP